MRLAGDNLDHYLPVTRTIEFKEQQPLRVTQHQVIVFNQHRLAVPDHAGLDMCGGIRGCIKNMLKIGACRYEPPYIIDHLSRRCRLYLSAARYRSAAMTA